MSTVKQIVNWDATRLLRAIIALKRGDGTVTPERNREKVIAIMRKEFKQKLKTTRML